jgi:hypothetical protein
VKARIDSVIPGISDEFDTLGAGLLRRIAEYRVRANGIEVNAHLGEMSSFPWEQGVAVPGPISPRAVEGMHRVR